MFIHFFISFISYINIFQLPSFAFTALYIIFYVYFYQPCYFYNIYALFLNTYHLNAIIIIKHMIQTDFLKLF